MNTNEQETPNGDELDDDGGNQLAEDNAALEGVNVEDTNFRVRRSNNGNSNEATPSNRAVLPGGGSSRRNIPPGNGLGQANFDLYDPMNNENSMQMYVQQQSSFERKQQRQREQHMMQYSQIPGANSSAYHNMAAIYN